MKRALGILYKDVASELRTRYAVNALFMFIVVTISVILFSVGSEKVSPYLAGGLFWVVVFFSAMSGLSRAFVSEEERGTVLTLHLIADPTTVFSGKLGFNVMLVFAMNAVIWLLYGALFDGFIIISGMLFFLTMILGSIGLAVSSTVIAAIIAKANSKGTLYPVLAFPILLPLMLTLVELTKYAADGTPLAEAYVELFILLSYDVVMTTASYLLFEIIWRE